MNTNTTPTKKTAKAKEPFTKGVTAVVVAPTGGRKETFDLRVYRCLEKGCGNQGSIMDGSFRRPANNPSDTVCVSCGGEFNRWVRDANV
jgi:hypothetical protein